MPRRVPGGAARRPGSRLPHWRDALVVAQVALSIVVLVGAGLCWCGPCRSFKSVDPGFDTQNILLFGINPSLAGYNDHQTSQLYRQLQERFAARCPAWSSASYSEEALLKPELVQHWMCGHLDGAPSQIECRKLQVLPVGSDFFSG